ncbi:MAG: hypothetical protein P857_52 [Candidatus Xenolissoclinum pacificiensis L6]|uniref:Uncharacterized protein n=1 Tax=Candidatus Xenolissoclinum pacificiensis L6 TaxID=1401685 RepID=W2V205_9RICK|nr:MAG: hypothetical protein P857_52 [Candidatus Xenolissoclinum pacificiensis L6]
MSPVFILAIPIPDIAINDVLLTPDSDVTTHIPDYYLEDLNVIFVNSAKPNNECIPSLPVSVLDNMVHYITKLHRSYLTIWSNNKQISLLSDKGLIFPNTIKLIEDSLAQRSPYFTRNLHFRIQDISILFHDPKYKLDDPYDNDMMQYVMALCLENDNTLSGFSNIARYLIINGNHNTYYSSYVDIGQRILPVLTDRILTHLDTAEQSEDVISHPIMVTSFDHAFRTCNNNKAIYRSFGKTPDSRVTTITKYSLMDYNPLSYQGGIVCFSAHYGNYQDTYFRLMLLNLFCNINKMKNYSFVIAKIYVLYRKLSGEHDLPVHCFRIPISCYSKEVFESLSQATTVQSFKNILNTECHNWMMYCYNLMISHNTKPIIEIFRSYCQEHTAEELQDDLRHISNTSSLQEVQEMVKRCLQIVFDQNNEQFRKGISEETCKYIKKNVDPDDFASVSLIIFLYKLIDKLIVPFHLECVRIYSNVGLLGQKYYGLRSYIPNISASVSDTLTSIETTASMLPENRDL